jgi:hypothetical protein
MASSGVVGANIYQPNFIFTVILFLDQGSNALQDCFSGFGDLIKLQNQMIAEILYWFDHFIDD